MNKADANHANSENDTDGVGRWKLVAFEFVQDLAFVKQQ